MGEGWPTRKKRFTLAAAFFAGVAAFLAAFAVAALYRPGAITAHDLSRLKQGMTRDEVRAILGEPTIPVRATMTGSDREEVWIYALPYSHWSVTKADYQLKFFDGRLDTWWKVKF